MAQVRRRRAADICGCSRCWREHLVRAVVLAPLCGRLEMMSWGSGKTSSVPKSQVSRQNEELCSTTPLWIWCSLQQLPRLRWGCCLILPMLHARKFYWWTNRTSKGTCTLLRRGALDIHPLAVNSLGWQKRVHDTRVSFTLRHLPTRDHCRLLCEKWVPCVLSVVTDCCLTVDDSHLAFVSILCL